MKEQNIQMIEKKICFEKSGEEMKISVQLININNNKQIKDFLETMFKEIKESLF